MTFKSTGAEQQRSLYDVVELIRLYTAQRASLDAALLLAASRARRDGINSQDFVATLKVIVPKISTPAALMAWLNAARSDAR